MNSNFTSIVSSNEEEKCDIENRKTFPLFENDNFEINQSGDDECISGSADGLEVREDEETEEEDEDGQNEYDEGEDDGEDYDEYEDYKERYDNGGVEQGQENLMDNKDNSSDSSNMSYNDLNSDEEHEKGTSYNEYYNIDDIEIIRKRIGEDGNREDSQNGADSEVHFLGGQKEVNISGLMKKKIKKKCINKSEHIYFDEIGIYKNNKIMNSEDIEDRMKYLLLLLSDSSKKKKKKKKNISIINSVVEKSSIIKELLFYYTYYYEYTKEMIKYLYYLFDIKELYLFLEINNMPKEIHLRTNTLKITRSNLMKILKGQNISVQEGRDKWNNVGIIVNDINSNVGSCNEYLYGYYMIQSSSSFIPVLELNAQENDIILDMCAAPGGKCTYLCALKKNRGLVYANDVNKLRCKAIEAHASRMGIHNLIVTCFDSLNIHKYISFQFDKILLDSFCSGTGVVNKNKSARRKSIKEIRELAQKQRKLLNNAINLVKNGGIVVYSTCSITVEENEQVINYILKKRDVNLLPTDIDIGDPGITHYRKKQFSSKIALCKRIYLHKHNYDNFFVAKLIKRSDVIFGEDLKRNAQDGNMRNKNTYTNNVKHVSKHDNNYAGASKSGKKDNRLNRKKVEGNTNSNTQEINDHIKISLKNKSKTNRKNAIKSHKMNYLNGKRNNLKGKKNKFKNRKEKKLQNQSEHVHSEKRGEKNGSVYGRANHSSDKANKKIKNRTIKKKKETKKWKNQRTKGQKDERTKGRKEERTK
ncbi:rRNA (cytosine-C(5))-methyltransferase [Plasmodium brasilianum]|uniref:rRNA (Cytosine-C(5))-methyltransferase n=1 Tax=Plasmodium brasilianum TaxID=5824 RepID=A0ACB9YA84_PLABR|nr:rRNA (cytosine-C(5))-methyltransferase [Plasmodium brasilianum]